MSGLHVRYRYRLTIMAVILFCIIFHITLNVSKSIPLQIKDEEEHREDIAFNTSNSIPPQIKDEEEHRVDIAFNTSNSIPTEKITTGTSAFPIDSLPLNDSSQLLNVTNFKFLINEPCSESPYIVVVFSSPGNYVKRLLIRSTWGSRVPLYFFFGETSTNQTLLDTESATYHDVVQGSFIDSYRNLTYKHTMVFKWVIYNCPRVRYVLKVDDDVFVNTARLEEFLTHTLSPNGTRHLLVCSLLLEHKSPSRTNDIEDIMSKWFVSVEEYPHQFYPTYCGGWSIMYSPDVLFKLYQSLQQDGNFFWIDDVFITGIKFSKLNLKHAKFDDWKRNDLLSANGYEDVRKYDPSTHMFVVLGNNAIYKEHRKELFEYFLNVTSDQSGDPGLVTDYLA